MRRIKVEVVRLALTSYGCLLLSLCRIGIRLDAAHRQYSLIKLDDHLAAIPGFTIPNERKYMKLFGSYLYSNKGFICELGCTFGSFTASLASGLRKGSKKIHCHDLFTWHKSFGDVLEGTEFAETLRYGDSFLPVFRHYTSGYESFIEPIAGDIGDVHWDESKKIELLVVDAMKNEFLADVILRRFYGQLEVGSYVFQQDFCHYHEPWIHLIHYQFKDCFTLVCHVEDTPSLVFRMTRKIEPERLRAGFDLQNFDEQRIRESFDYSISLVSEEPARQNILAAKVFCLLARHFFEEAERTLDQLLEEYDFIEPGNLEFVIQVHQKAKEDKQLILDTMRNEGKNLITDLDYVTDINY